MSPPIMKIGVYLLFFILMFFIGLLAVDVFNIGEEISGTFYGEKRPIIYENFNEGLLKPEVWQLTCEEDFKENIIDVYDIDPLEGTDYRLRLGINTIGTKDETVKFLGVKSIKKLDLIDGDEISFDIDWNNQSNGCYLTGAFYLCPTSTNGNPEKENDWIKFEYIGVPPGKNARSIIINKINGNEKLLYTDGWPKERTGRQITNQHIKIVLENGSFKVSENNRQLYVSAYNLNFTSAYIYLQMSSHSNYPMRELYFDNIKVAKYME